ncbi:hypothetical protein FN846DRAFT_933450 [Sphaerosporella brunnea]|uniref:FAD-binding domain-containing protein n=1 Tax=Sphaerosporella brunnea TaxID=1250544 RepID=A0A5J5F6Y1_9PEZI|nr:hypothetical protein FN846DRAFT_933450 [Sphaerosporella brunnea]
MSDRRPLTAILLGCNLTSLSLALALTRQNGRFILLARDALLIPDDDDSAVVLHPPAVAVLDWLGVWAQLEAEGGWRVTVDRLEHPLAILPRRALLHTLLSALPPGCVHAGTRAVDIRRDKSGGVTVLTAGMEMFCGDVVVDVSAPSPTAAAEACFVSAATRHLAKPAFSSGPPGAAVLAAARWCWALIPAPAVSEEQLALGPLGAAWAARTWGSIEPATVGFVAPSWFRAGSRTLRMGRAAWTLPPLALLGDSMELEAVAALANALALDDNDPEAAFARFETGFGQRIQSALWCARLATGVATGMAWWHRAALACFPVSWYKWAYAEFVRGAEVLHAPPPLRSERKIGGVGLRARRALEWGGAVAAAAAVVAVVACVRWRVHIAAARVVGRAVVSAGRSRRF